MGNTAEEMGIEGLIFEIKRHSSNRDRDPHTKHSLNCALRRKNIGELREILDDVKNGKVLPDNFQ